MPDWHAIDLRPDRDTPPDDEPTPAPDGGAGGWEAFDNPDAPAPATTVDQPEPQRATVTPAPDGGAGGWEAFDNPDAPGDQPTTDDIRVSDLQDKSRADIRTLADRLGLLPYGLPDADGEPRKWKDPDTGQQRLRIDEGHVDTTTGEPYNDPKAAIPHTHAYDQDGQKIVDPDDGNAHFPLL